jgi:cytoskeletal protein CcmA (bactofilin family)
MSIKKKLENFGGPNKNSPGRPSPSVSGDINTILGKETSFKGVLTYEGTVKIDGKVEGEIIARDTLIIGEDAEINADIDVGRLISRGRIRGNITVKDRAEFFAPAVLRGNIQTPVIVIEDGVIFEGKCEMQTAGDDSKTELKITPLHKGSLKTGE